MERVQKITTKEDQIANIKQRIIDEHRKHKTLEWEEIAARKIYSTHLARSICNIHIDKNSCDCFVGFLSGEKVNKSTINIEIESIVNIQPTFEKYGLLNGKPQTKSQIVDGRKGYLSRFVYCPYCGEKINWNHVLGNCR